MNNDLCISRGFNLVLFCRTTVFCHNMAHYEQIGRKSVVNSCLRSHKPNKIKGLIVQWLHCRDFVGLTYSDFYTRLSKSTPKEALF